VGSKSQGQFVIRRELLQQRVILDRWSGRGFERLPRNAVELLMDREHIGIFREVRRRELQSKPLSGDTQLSAARRQQRFPSPGIGGLRRVHAAARIRDRLAGVRRAIRSGLDEHAS
jgi:hypothetical protein